MDIQGTATIQLFDKQGKLLSETMDKNIITKAVENLLNIDPSFLMYNSGLSDILKNNTPLVSKALGGILLFNESIPEESDHIIPSPFTEVGHAGKDYAGPNKYRGSYNTTESGKITNGYRHVWDFATDKAVGTITSIGLTSLIGGNTGFHTDVGIYTDTFSFGSATNLAVQQNTAPICNIVTSSGNLLGNFEQDIFLFAIKKSANTITFNKVKGFDGNIPIDYTITAAGYTGTIIDTKDVVASSGSFYETLYCTTTEDGKILFIAYVSSSTCMLYKVNPLTLAVETTDIVVLSASVLNSAGCAFTEYQGAYYLATSLMAYKFSLTGELIREVLTFADANTKYWCMLGNTLCAYSNLNLYYINTDGTLGLSVPRGNNDAIGTNIVPSIDLKMPYLLMVTPVATTALSTGRIATFTPYLATINNLDKPTIKTNTQFMKVSYEILYNW